MKTKILTFIVWNKWVYNEYNCSQYKTFILVDFYLKHMIFSNQFTTDSKY